MRLLTRVWNYQYLGEVQKKYGVLLRSTDVGVLQSTSSLNSRLAAPLFRKPVRIRCNLQIIITLKKKIRRREQTLIFSIHPSSLLCLEESWHCGSNIIKPQLFSSIYVIRHRNCKYTSAVLHVIFPPVSHALKARFVEGCAQCCRAQKSVPPLKKLGVNWSLYFFSGHVIDTAQTSHDGNHASFNFGLSLNEFGQLADSAHTAF